MSNVEVAVPPELRRITPERFAGKWRIVETVVLRLSTKRVGAERAELRRPPPHADRLRVDEHLVDLRGDEKVEQDHLTGQEPNRIDPVARIHLARLNVGLNR